MLEALDDFAEPERSILDLAIRQFVAAVRLGKQARLYQDVVLQVTQRNGDLEPLVKVNGKWFRASSDCVQARRRADKVQRLRLPP
jgi:hypothetical protein